MKATRWPALVVIPLVLAVILLVDEPPSTTPASPTDTSIPAEPGREPDLAPTAADASAVLSTWYCPAGTGGGNDLVDRSVVVVTNAGDEDRTGRLELYGPDGPLGSEEIDVPAASRWQLDLGRVTDADVVGALLEVDGGEVATAMVVSGPHGRTVTPCTSTPAGRWYLPAATTTLDARAVLTLFNPFPDDAILEIAFADRDGVRVPTGFESFPVPPSSVVQVDLTDLITVRPQFATSIQARSGQVVAAMVQQWDGSEDVEGLAVVPGAPRGSTTWSFPAGRWDADSRETYVVYNPGDAEAQVDVSVGLDDPATNGAVTPFEITVPAGSFVVLGSHQEEWGRVPEGVAHNVRIRAVDGEPIVALQRLSVVGDERPGVAMALGAPVTAQRWILPVVDLEGAVGSVTVLNPDPESRSRVELAGVAGGETAALEPVELAEAARVVLTPARDLGLSTAGGVVVSSTPTVVSSAWAFETGRAWMPAVPVADDGEPTDPTTGTTVPSS